MHFYVFFSVLILEKKKQFFFLKHFFAFLAIETGAVFFFF